MVLMETICNSNLYDNIVNNKVYLEIPNCEFEQSIDIHTEKKDYNSLFDNISLNYIKKNSTNNIVNYDSFLNVEITKNNPNVNENKIVDNTNNYVTNKTFTKNNKTNTIDFKFEKDSFINELSKLLMKNNREIRNEIKDFVNSTNNQDYLKQLTRSYKKFIIDIHNLLINENLDKLLTDNLLTITSKLYTINIIIFKDNIYKIYKSAETNDYYVFEKHIRNTDRNKYINFKLVELDIDNIDNYLCDKKIYIDEKKFKNMKVDELRVLANKNNIVSTQKKSILVEELCKIYNMYN
tara:strand:- start:1753 stop:2634 length:882 start_codon:yes stop_codon:yes gene_type:complete